jgi:hypothetical protein
MTIHICRDFLSLATNQPSGSMYITSCFAIGVLGYTQVGHTNFNVSGSSLVSSGISASITSSAGTTSVTIPSGTYVISASDVNRILALKSDTNPRHNSGLFRVQTVDTVNNRLNIDYRSSDASISEVETLKWTIFVSENDMPGVSNAVARVPVGGSGYQSMGPTYNGPRVILQSPHSSSWQVRFCQESTTDRTNVGVTTSVAPGFSGSAIGDFQTGSFDISRQNPEHLHGAMWFNSSTDRFRGLQVGINQVNSEDQTFSAQARYYIWGDDDKGSIVTLIRNVANYQTGWFAFGLSEDDEPAPPLISQKLFSYGTQWQTTGHITWNGRITDTQFQGGVAYGLQKHPVVCTLACFVMMGDGRYLVHRNANAVNSNLLGATELQRVCLYAGTSDTPKGQYTYWPANQVGDHEPRRMGSFPIARQGRSNFASWTLTSDSNKAWLHSLNGVYLPWEGPSILI